MKTFTTPTFLAVLLLLPYAAAAQLAEITLLPGQTDRTEVMSNAKIIEAANGDLVVILIENGEWTDTSEFPWMGTPARLLVLRSSDGGDSWTAPELLRTAIADHGTQGIASAQAAVLPSGRIVITFFYLLDVFPNFGKTTEIHYSDDHGATWAKLTDYGSDATSMAARADGRMVAGAYTVDPVNGDYYGISTSDDGGTTWSAPVRVVAYDDVCWEYLTSDPDSGEFIALTTSCGANTTTYRYTSADGVTWSAPEAILQSNSLFGANSNLVFQPDGSTWLVYRDAGAVVYRTSDDRGATWSEETIWTAGVMENDGWDLWPTCAPAARGPICTLYMRPDGPNFQAYVGIPGISTDPRFAPVSVAGLEELPTGVTLEQNFPNPFNPLTTIAYALPGVSDVTIRVVDALGREVMRNEARSLAAGQYQLQFDASNLPSGTYLYRLESKFGSETKRMVLLK